MYIIPMEVKRVHVDFCIDSKLENAKYRKGSFYGLKITDNMSLYRFMKNAVILVIGQLEKSHNGIYRMTYKKKKRGIISVLRRHLKNKSLVGYIIFVDDNEDEYTLSEEYYKYKYATFDLEIRGGKSPRSFSSDKLKRYNSFVVVREHLITSDSTESTEPVETKERYSSVVDSISLSYSTSVIDESYPDSVSSLCDTIIKNMSENILDNIDSVALPEMTDKPNVDKLKQIVNIVSVHKEKARALQTKCDDLIKLVTDKDAEIMSMGEKLSDASKVRKELSKKITKKEAEVDKHLLKLDALNDEIADLKKTIASYEEHLEFVVGEIDDTYEKMCSTDSCLSFKSIHPGKLDVGGTAMRFDTVHNSYDPDKREFRIVRDGDYKISLQSSAMADFNVKICTAGKKVVVNHYEGSLKAGDTVSVLYMKNQGDPCDVYVEIMG